MAEKDLILKEKLVFNGIFDFPGSYRFAHTWFKDEGYGVNEGRYSEKVSGNARAIRVEWMVKKRLSDYFMIEDEITFEISDLTDVEAEIDGKKKKLNKGRVEMSIKAVLVSDWESKWEKTPVYRFWREVYNKYIIPGRVQELKDKVEEDAQTFKEEMKAYLEIVGKR